ncbi:nucleotidyltransferase [Lapidilactobacillus bayanensis]|uniref:nucleotidyltransferase n=1 Tax=Lapidilactobacillus bayanensis TaxID=2485998 RepID=UPI000F79B050|nr:nucleotidyltransferase [Lapidilactobacillus bayanensis]
MKACGIIAEYNPFHNGHAYQLAQARKKTGADAIVVVMSGNYVQRGEIAVMDKWQRAQMALNHGADLVIELPFVVACQSADRFANGALAILEQLGCNYLAFGVEQDNFNYQKFSQQVAPDLQQQQFTVDYTKTYATQWNDFLERELGQRVTQPNQLLALSYALANSRLAQPLTFVPIERVGAAHDELQTNSDRFASATAIRELLIAGDFTTAQQYVPDDLTKLPRRYLSWTDLWPLLHYQLTVNWPESLTDIYQMSEGLEYRFWQQNQTSNNFRDFLQEVKSKRYTYARLRRLALYTLLNVRHSEVLAAERHLPQIRVLGFNQVGQAYLHQAHHQNDVKVLTKVTADLGKPDGALGLQVRVDRLVEQLTGQDQNFHRQVLIED